MVNSNDKYKNLLVGSIFFSILFVLQSSSTGSEPNSPILSPKQKVPSVIEFGLKYPSKEEAAIHKINNDPNVINKIENKISKCLKPDFYDANNAKVQLSSFKDWPVSNAVARVKHYINNGYIFYFCDHNYSFTIGIKRIDNQNIWDMNNDPNKFVSWAMNKFFQNEIVGPKPNTRLFFAKEVDGSDGFYFIYSPMNKELFYGCYLWTDGNTIVLHAEQYFEEDKAKMVPGRFNQ